jgi:hypothetical protein
VVSGLEGGRIGELWEEGSREVNHTFGRWCGISSITTSRVAPGICKTEDVAVEDATGVEDCWLCIASWYACAAALMLLGVGVPFCSGSGVLDWDIAKVWL